MNLDEIREFLLSRRGSTTARLVPGHQGRHEQEGAGRAEGHPQEALVLNESLAEQISAKLARMDGFRAKLRSDAQRCRELLTELD